MISLYVPSGCTAQLLLPILLPILYCSVLIDDENAIIYLFY